MKLRLASLATIPVLFLALQTCDSGGGTTGPEPQTGKPGANDTSTVPDTQKVVPGSDSLKAGADSLRIQLNGTQGTAITYIRFDAASGTTYNFQLAPRGTFRLKVLRLDPDSTPQVTTTRVADSVVFPCTNSGTYLLEVTGPAGKTPLLKVARNKILPLYFIGADSFEFDNRISYAKPYDFAQGKQARSSHYAGLLDTDWVKVELDSGRTYPISVQGTGSSRSDLGRPEVALFAADGSPKTLLGGSGTYSIASFRKESVYLRLRPADTVSVTYSLSVGNVAGLPARAIVPDAFEPDDLPANATRLATDTLGALRTLHGDSLTTDRDNFLFDADSGTRYTIRIDASAVPGLELASAQGVAQALRVVGDSAKSAIREFSCTRSGRYVLTVAGVVATSYRVRLLAQKGLVWFAEPDTFEPDDSIATAVKVPGGRATYDRNLVSGDVDWFSISADSGQVGTFALFDSVPSGAYAIQWSMIDAQGRVVRDETVLGRARGIWSWYFARKETIHILVQRTSKKDTSLRQAYSLQTELAANDDPFEIDGSRSAAWNIPLDSAARTRSVTVSDTDWIRLRIPAGSRLDLEFKSVATPGIEWCTFDLASTSRFLETGTSSLSWPTSGISLYSPRDTEFLVRVLPKSPSSGSIPYTVRAASGAMAPDRYEPDETSAAAVVLPLDTHWVARNLFPGDEDWVAYDVPAGSFASFQVLPTDWSDYGAFSAKVLGPDGTNQLINWDGTRFSIPVTVPGRYRMHFSATPDCGTVKSYSFRASVVPYPDAFEPDDRLSTAKDLAMDSSASRHASFTNDEDWIRVRPKAGALRFVSLSTESGATLGFEIRKADSSLYSGKTSLGLNKAIQLGSDGDTNTYFIRVLPKFVDRNTWTAYTVRGWMVGDPDTLEATDSPSRALAITGTEIVRALSIHDTDLFRVHLEAGQAVQVDWTTLSTLRWTVLGGQKPWDYLFDGVLRAETATDFLVAAVDPYWTTGYERYSIKCHPIPMDTSVRHQGVSTAIRMRSDSTPKVLANAYHADTWVAIPLRAGVAYTVGLQADVPKVRYALFRQDSSLVAEFTDSVSTAIPPGTDTMAYLRIGSVPASGSMAPVRASIVAFPMANDRYEPDSTMALGAVLPFDSVQQHVLVLGDTDWISGPVLSKSYLFDVEIRTSARAVWVSMYDGTGDLVERRFFESWSPVYEMLPVTGEVRFRIEAIDSAYAKPISYSIKVSHH